MEVFFRSWFLYTVMIGYAQGLRWEVSLREPIRDLAILPDGNLLVSTSKSIEVRSAETGQPVWRCQECQNIPDPDWRPISPLSPYLYESKPLHIEFPQERQEITAAGIPNTSPVSPLNYLMPQNYLILNTKTGKVLYSTNQNRQFSLIVSRVFLPEAGVLIILGRGPKNPQKKLTQIIPIIAAYDVETGAEIYRQEAFKSSISEQLVPVGMVSEGERVFYMSDQRVYAIHPRTGQFLWQVSVFQWFASEVRPRLFVDKERQQLLVFARERLQAYRFSDGASVWSQPLKVPRQEILGLFSTAEGILLFTDDRQSPTDAGRGGRDLLVRPLAFLVDPASGQNRWGERLKTPGLFVGYVPMDESRILALFARERFFSRRDAFWTPDKDWELTFDVLDVRSGRWLFKNPISLRGGILAAARVLGGLLVQTTQTIRAYDEEGTPLWERRIRRPMSLPFYIAEEGTNPQVFFIEEMGQVFVWRGPGTQPENFGKPLQNFAGRDEPQGLFWQNKRLHVWGTSSLYILDEKGQVVQNFVRELPGFSAPVRILGVALAVGGTAARWALAQRLTWLRSPEDQLPEAVQLRQAIQNNPLYAPLLMRVQTLDDLLFLFGRENGQINLYAVRLSDASLAFQKSLGSNLLSTNLKNIEIDPNNQRLYIVAGDRIQAY